MGIETVTVACKLPSGLRLRVFDMVKVQEPVLGGGVRDVDRAQQTGEMVKINGYNRPTPRKSSGLPTEEPTYALTYNVPKDFWDKWYEQNRGTKLVKERLIFAAKGAENTKAIERENERRRSGFEPLDPENLPKGLDVRAKGIDVKSYDKSN